MYVVEKRETPLHSHLMSGYSYFCLIATHDTTTHLQVFYSESPVLHLN